MIIRKFTPGDEWLYIKIYTGAKTSDQILEQVVFPLVDCFKNKKYISQWFFIRYNDPKFHLRLRFKLTDLNYFKIVLHNVSSAFKCFVDSGEISNVILDSYVREIGRYGETTIQDAEQLFFKSSELILNFLDFDDEEKLMVSMFYIDTILSKIELLDQDKLQWIGDYNTAFKKEFNGDKYLNSQLDKKFRSFKPKYLEFVHSDEFSDIKNLIIRNITESNSAIEKVKEHNNDSLSRFFQSIFHMHINRSFVSNQRLFEMIMYDFLLRHYKNMIYGKSNLQY
ncbi:thiopeptide-type bacteriocin biosynthesis protein [Epilithonimonas sp.]|uniref:thiopeptide-type bacteriocin biosynthesis protein n=1 Tax=Epilithonimonas sp. TaxID=2894511 RepID=UPI00289D0B1C|nr:thiopeptide-type bacteriocin biosynthesis protein [Epilithonimonas sp.]